MIRLFIALPIPAEIRNELSRLACGIPGARWVAPENYHLTLRFVGNVDTDIAEDVDNALLRIDAEGVTVDLDSIGWFGTKKRPTTIVAKAVKSPELLHLQRKIESAMVRIGLGPDERKFMPHITLARLKGTTMMDVEQYCASNAGVAQSSFMAHDVTLYSSFLSQSGAIYTPEADYPLRLPAPLTYAMAWENEMEQASGYRYPAEMEMKAV